MCIFSNQYDKIQIEKIIKIYRRVQMKNYFGYTDKLCVVTGASSGMGKATVEMLVDLGAKVYAIDLNPCTVEGITKFIKCNLARQDRN